MSWPVYSTRFIRAAAPGVMNTYVVPLGYRAVVKRVECVSGSPTGGDLIVYVAGYAVVAHTFPAGLKPYFQDAFAVAYAGESIATYHYVAEIFVQVAGYLFQDPTGRHESENDGIEMEVGPDVDPDPRTLGGAAGGPPVATGARRGPDARAARRAGDLRDRRASLAGVRRGVALPSAAAAAPTLV